VVLQPRYSSADFEEGAQEGSLDGDADMEHCSIETHRRQWVEHREH